MINRLIDKWVDHLSFPLYPDDNKATVKLSQSQKGALNLFKEKIKKREGYRLVSNPCLCSSSKNDVVISEKDRYGIAVKNVLCMTCGLIRSDKVLDLDSTTLFYKEIYRDLYDPNFNPSQLFKGQVAKGDYIKSRLKKEGVLNQIETVVDIGCATGGTLYPFYQIGKSVLGLDYDQRYMLVGQDKGMSLISKEFHELEYESVDLLILNHVFEHFVDPIPKLITMINKLKDTKYLFMEVPGIFWIDKMYYAPIKYFQNAHIYNFYNYFLVSLFRQIGMTVLYSNERCQILVQKPNGWRMPTSFQWTDPQGKDYAQKIQCYLKACYVKDKLFLYKDDNIARLKRPFGILLEQLKLKEMVKQCLGMKDYQWLG